MSVSAGGARRGGRALFLLLLPLPLLLPPPATARCPASCVCNVPGEVHCTFRYLTAVPDGIQTAAESLNLGYNTMTVLRETDLSGLQHLELLMLHSNSIHNIEDGAFQDLKSLQILKMSYNKVKEINKGTFKGLDGLLRLHMDHNQIRFIHPEAFYGLTNLQLVNLEGNHLQQLHPDTFITRRHSQVFKVSSLRTIHLSDNLLTGLPADIFSGCSQLENLSLHGNRWMCDCRMNWIPKWVQRNPGVLKCKRDKGYQRGPLCPVCDKPSRNHNRPLTLLPGDAFTCAKPWIQPQLKQKNITLDEGDFTPVSSRDFIAPLGSMKMNLTDRFHKDVGLSCTVQRPSKFENLTVSLEEQEEGDNITLLTSSVTTYLVCNVEYEHMQQLWQILASYSDAPLKLKRGFMLTRNPEMVFRYSQMIPEEGEEGIYTNIVAEMKAAPAWLMQDEIVFQLDRTTTTFSTLHVKYQSPVSLRIENTSPKKDRYSWTMIKQDNQTKTAHTVLTGGVAELTCQVQGEPKPLLEWILPDGSKVRAPYSSEDRRMIITAEGKLTVRGADASDTGLYICIATNYLDADVLVFRVTVLSPDVEETSVNGVQVSMKPGENLLFDCASSGSPEATVHWILPDHSVLDASAGNKMVYQNGTLEIRGSTERDRGFFRCLVANHLGVDLLVSQVTLTGERSETGKGFESEGSGMNLEVEVEPSLTDDKVSVTEIPFHGSSERTEEESRIITLDPPYPRLRSEGKGGAEGGRKWRRRRPVSSRRFWSTRVFEKTQRKVDPDKFAEFMKKAQNGARLKSQTEGEKVKYLESPDVFSGDGENGSGESHSEHRNALPPTVKATADHSQPARKLGQENRQSRVTAATTNARGGALVTAETYRIYDVETRDGNRIDLSAVRKETDRKTTDANKSILTYNATKRAAIDNNDRTQHHRLSHETCISCFDETTEPFTRERTTRESSTRLPANFKHTVTDSLHETQLQVSGERPPEPETSTGAAFSFTTDPNVTPMKDAPDPVELFVRTDPKSKTTFTAVTTTERQQDQITFRTTQTIKSPRLHPGSTIISRQRIHIIPHKRGRGGARRRTFQGRRRIIKPGRITDIQSFINKNKQPSVKKEESTTVPYRVDPSTESKQEGANGYMTSADAPEVDPTDDTLFSTNKELFTSTVTATTAASNVIKGKIPWNRIFGGRQVENIAGTHRKPFITPKPSTTAQTTAMTSTTPFATTAAKTFTESKISYKPRPTADKESSLDEDDGEFSSGDFAIITQRPSVKDLTTMSSYYPGSFTTAATPVKIQTLPSPPTARPQTIKQPEEGFSSGSGGYPKNWFATRKRPDGTRGHHWRRRKPIRERRPLEKLTTTKLYPISTALTTAQPPTTAVPHRTGSGFRPRSTPSMTVKRPAVSIPNDHKLDQNFNPYEDSDVRWFYTTTKTPLIPSATSISKGWYTTARNRGHSNVRPTTQGDNGPTRRLTTERRIRPTVQSGRGKSRGEKEFTFDTVTILTVEPENAISPAPFDKELGEAVSSDNNHGTSLEATSGNSAGLEPTTRVMTSKPKIVGGNAASFTVLSNSDAFLPCEATGNPEPKISWKRFSSITAGTTVAINGRVGKFQVLRNGTLLIQNANIKDRGQYLCLAENDYGTDKLLVTLSVVAYPSRILEPKARDIKAHEGNTVEMNCKAEGRPTPMVSWILANRTHVRGYSSTNRRVSVTTLGTLVIEQVSVSDRGHYRCIASNPAGADTATVRLHVVAAPPAILEEKRQQVKAVFGQNLWLPCTGKGSPQPIIHWVLHDGSVLHSDRSNDRGMSVYANGTLHIRDVAESYNGTFECLATSSTGSERRVVALTVERKESAPVIVAMSQRVTELFFGDRLVLNCSATGDPIPRIMWRLPSKAVVDQWHRMGSRIQVLDDGTLIVNSVIDKDAGNYLCVARNHIGDDLQLMKVRVSMKPAKIEHKLYGKKRVPYGNDLKVDCKASGAPKPEISWGLPDGTVVNSALQSDGSNGGGRTRRYTLFDNGTLYLNRVGISEEGDYTCIAENQVGKDEMQFHITVVTVAPRIRSTSQTYARVKPGGNIRFDCEAHGEPKPKILWMLPTNDMIAASNERYLMHVNGSLDIRDVKSLDSGEYVCIARNPAGENRRVYKIDIDGNPPVINGFQRNRTVIQDFATKYTRKFIDCKVDGAPPPAITWIMPDNIFLKAPYFGSRINVHHNGTLEIKNVRPTDTAEFICMARNDGGEAVMVVQLKVTSLLRRPIFKSPFNERIVAQIGKTTVLNCSANGHPEPEISWTLPNGTRLSGEYDNSQYHFGREGTLIIYSPRMEDAGKYRCGARNILGYIQKLIVLDVGQKPYILTRPRGIIRGAFGEPLSLHCLSEGNPKPRIYWTTPGGQTLARPQTLGRYQLLENGTLVVRDTTLHDRGNYICRAQSDAGEAALSVPVVIMAYTPRITTGPPPSLSAVAGTPIRLNCGAVGIPKPEITWELPDRSVLSTAQKGRRTGSELLHPPGTLVIQSLTASDSGTYTCLAKNVLGRDLRVTYVHVL